jgi:hypothetical protein
MSPTSIHVLLLHRTAGYLHHVLLYMIVGKMQSAKENKSEGPFKGTSYRGNVLIEIRFSHNVGSSVHLSKREMG